MGMSGFQIVMALDKQNMFESAEHRTRFGDLIECYMSYPFFTPGLCKCMYLSAWDDEHFFVILDILNAMTLGKDKNTEEMEDNGKVEADLMEGRDREIYLMSGAFLSGTSYEPDLTGLDEEAVRIITQGQKAAAMIDELLAE